MPKYVRKDGESRIFIYTDALAMRSDISPYNPEAARIQIEAARKLLEEKKAQRQSRAGAGDAVRGKSEVQVLADELAAIESEIKQIDEENRIAMLPPEEQEALEKAKKVESPTIEDITDQDKEIQQIKAMTDPKEVEEYLVLNYGIDVDRRKLNTLGKIRDYALKLRTERIAETRK